MMYSSQLRSSAFQCLFKIVLIAILDNELWSTVEMAEGNTLQKQRTGPSPAASCSTLQHSAILPVFLLSDATCSTQCGDTLNNEIKSRWSHAQPS